MNVNFPAAPSRPLVLFVLGNGVKSVIADRVVGRGAYFGADTFCPFCLLLRMFVLVEFHIGAIWPNMWHLVLG